MCSFFRGREIDREGKAETGVRQRLKGRHEWEKEWKTTGMRERKDGKRDRSGREINRD